MKMEEVERKKEKGKKEVSEKSANFLRHVVRTFGRTRKKNALKRSRSLLDVLLILCASLLSRVCNKIRKSSLTVGSFLFVFRFPLSFSVAGHWPSRRPLEKKYRAENDLQRIGRTLNLVAAARATASLDLDASAKCHENLERQRTSVDNIRCSFAVGVVVVAVIRAAVELVRKSDFLFLIFFPSKKNNNNTTSSLFRLLSPNRDQEEGTTNFPPRFPRLGSM